MVVFKIVYAIYFLPLHICKFSKKIKMVPRIRRIIEEKGISPSRFADRIGVPRSTISHILSERNKPSLEVIQKILDAFPDIPVDWLVLGKGFFKSGEYSLFDTMKEDIENPNQEDNKGHDVDFKSEELIEENRSSAISKHKSTTEYEKRNEIIPSKAVKVIVLQSDGTFLEYKPSQNPYA